MNRYKDRIVTIDIALQGRPMSDDELEGVILVDEHGIALADEFDVVFTDNQQ